MDKFKKVFLNEPLHSHTTYRMGGPVDYLIQVANEESLWDVLLWVKDRGLPMMILGGGSNLLISDAGFRGVMIQLVGELAQIKVIPEQGIIEVGAGATFPKLTHQALQLGMPLALGWHGTPGQVGGALKMNAGSAIHGEIGPMVQEVHAINMQGKKIISQQEAGFSYRNSQFAADLILTKAILNIGQTKDPAHLKEQAQILTQKRKQTQPKQPSAGSCFKNPPKDYAGRLIEACGLKGKSVGGAQISPVHANFIVNVGGAKAYDVWVLSQIAREEVYKKFNIQLEYEIKLVGNFN